MLNRLRAWFYRRIQGEPITPLSVQVSEPYTIKRLEGIRGHFWVSHEQYDGNDIYPHGWFEHDSVQLDADEMRWY